jgi:hypothetical protein
MASAAYAASAAWRENNGNQHWLRANLAARLIIAPNSTTPNCALSAPIAAAWHQQAKNDNEKMKASAAASNGEIMAAAASARRQRGGV